MQIKEMQEEELERKDVGITFKLEMKFLPVLADIEYNGMHFNKEVWQNTYEKNKVALDVAKTDLDSYVICNFKDSQFVDRQYDIFSEGFKCRVSWRSQQQVVNFFKHLGICPEEKGKPTLNAKVLRSFVPSVKEEKLRKLLNNYIRYKELSQATNTFGQKFFKYVHPITNRLYSNYNQILNTGRISSSSPNLQNIPAALGFRKAFDAPEGWKIVNADYSGQEQIILANKSEDPELQQFYTDGHSDMHSFIASKIYPELRDLPLDEIKKNHKDKRQIAKAAGFAINYGGTGYTIAKNLGISEKEGDAVYNAYFLAFPNLKKYFDKVQRISLNQGYILIDPITRRKNWFRKPENNRERAAIERNALNYPIQGEAGGITKLAPIYYREWIMENNLEDYILITNLVHDEINIEAKEEYAELAAKNLEICMQKAADVWCKTIKLSADAAIVDYWSH
jgi:DNA polymerase-1